ncbi:UxaA family hydrolase [Cytobacillus sp. BC1816]|uniref:UxaA family hydrolase n=1 Tax=Cytobacillus sp. BC1816 TaxID=3440154 RepID=UPI003F50FC02
MMSQKYNAIKLDRKDNVAVALRSIKPGEFLAVQGENEAIEIKENIPYGHKIAAINIPKDSKIIKYGECMGISTEEINPGYHVHVSNVRGLKEEERLSALMEVHQR